MPPDATELSFETILERAVDRAIARQLAPVLADLAALRAQAIPEYVGAEEAAELLGVTVVTVRRMCARGALAGVRAGKTWRVRRDALRVASPEDVARLAREARSRP